MNSSYDSGEDEVLFVKLEGLKEQVKFGPSGPNVVLRSLTPRWLNFPKPQTPKLWNFLRFDNFIEFVLWFWRKWGPVCEIRRLKGESEIWPKWPQTPRSLNLSKPQSPKLWNFLRFCYWIHLMIPEKMRPFVKIGAKVPDLCLDTTFGPKLQ